MTRIIQISAAAVLAAFASTAFVSAAQATHNLRLCNVTSTNAGDEVRRVCGGKELQIRKRRVQKVTLGAAAAPVRRTQNFKAGTFYYKGNFKEGSNGGGNGNGGNGNGGNGNGGSGAGGGATGSSP